MIFLLKKFCPREPGIGLKAPPVVVVVTICQPFKADLIYHVPYDAVCVPVLEDAEIAVYAVKEVG